MKTRHGVGTQYLLNGNVSDTFYFSQRSVPHNDFVATDIICNSFKSFD